MDTVSKVMSWIYSWIDRNNDEIESLTPQIGDPNRGDLVLDSRRVRELADQNETWMLIAKTLHEAEDRNIRNILSGGGN